MGSLKCLGTRVNPGTLISGCCLVGTWPEQMVIAFPFLSFLLVISSCKKEAKGLGASAARQDFVAFKLGLFSKGRVIAGSRYRLLDTGF